jgi:hypothetical protein
MLLVAEQLLSNQIILTIDRQRKREGTENLNCLKLQLIRTFLSIRLEYEPHTKRCAMTFYYDRQRNLLNKLAAHDYRMIEKRANLR